MFCRHELDMLSALPKYRDYHVDHDRERLLNNLHKTRADAARKLEKVKEERDARVKLYHEIRSKAADKRRRDIKEQNHQTDERHAVRVGERAARALVEMEAIEEKAAAKDAERITKLAAEKKRFDAETTRRLEAARSREKDDKAWGWHYTKSPGSVSPCGKAIAATTPTASGKATPSSSTGATTPIAAQSAAGGAAAAPRPTARPTSARAAAMTRKPTCAAHLVVDAAHAAASAGHRQSIKRPSSAPVGRTPRGPTERLRHYEIQAQLQALLYTPHGRRGTAAADFANATKQLNAWGASARPQGVRPGQMTLEERLAHRTYSSSKAERARLYAEALSDARREVIALRIVEAEVHPHALDNKRSPPRAVQAACEGSGPPSLYSCRETRRPRSDREAVPLEPRPSQLTDVAVRVRPSCRCTASTATSRRPSGATPRPPRSATTGSRGCTSSRRSRSARSTTRPSSRRRCRRRTCAPSSTRASPATSAARRRSGSSARSARATCPAVHALRSP